MATVIHLFLCCIVLGVLFVILPLLLTTFIARREIRMDKERSQSKLQELDLVWIEEVTRGL